ncbi:MAG: transposase, partial [Haliea sp.]
RGAATLLPVLPGASELISDKGYDSGACRKALLERRITPCIPPRAKLKHPATYCKTLYKQRHKVENLFARIKDRRRIAMRYNRCAHTFFSAICIAATVIFWINQWVLTLLHLWSAIVASPPPWRRSVVRRCLASDPCGMTTFSGVSAPSLFIVSNSCMWPTGTTDQKEESMNTVSQDQIIGIDGSRDWLDIHCLPDGARLRFPNTAEGHDALIGMARSIRALVCFEATGGQEWQLWAALDGADVRTRQLPPAQIKAFAASRGTRAKTDRIDAELIACFMAFRPEAGRDLPHGKLRLLRALKSKRGQLVETRKRLSVQIKAQDKLGTAALFADMDSNPKEFLDCQITALEGRGVS